MVKEI